MTHRLDTTNTRSRFRSIATSLALVAAGTFIGVSSQQFASADISTGDRPVLIPIEPCRLSDTRPGDNQVGPRSVPLGAGDTHTVDTQEAGTPCTGKIPADATALSLNVTALNATELSFLTIWAGGDRPLAASLNPAPGQPPVPNAVTTQLSVDNEFEIYNNAGSVNIVTDVNGYYTNHNHDDRYALLDHQHDGRYALDATSQKQISVVSHPGDQSVFATTTERIRQKLFEFTFDAPAGVAIVQVSSAIYSTHPYSGAIHACSLRADDNPEELTEQLLFGSGGESESIVTLTAVVEVASARTVEISLFCGAPADGTVTSRSPEATATLIPS